MDDVPHMCLVYALYHQQIPRNGRLDVKTHHAKCDGRNNALHCSVFPHRQQCIPSLVAQLGMEGPSLDSAFDQFIGYLFALSSAMPFESRWDSLWRDDGNIPSQTQS